MKEPREMVVKVLIGALFPRPEIECSMLGGMGLAGCCLRPQSHPPWRRSRNQFL